MRVHALAAGARDRLRQGRVAGQTQDRPGQRGRIARRHQQAGLAVHDELGHARQVGGDDRTLARQRLANRAGEPGAGVGGVDHDVGGGQDLWDVLAVADDEHAPAEPALAGVVAELGDARRRRADEEQPRVGQAGRDPGHGVEHVAPAAPRAHADLGDDELLGRDPELAADRAAVDAGMEPLDVGAGIDHHDLVRRDAGGDQVALDRLADRDDRVHTPARVAEAVRPAQAEADAAVQHEQRARAHEASQQGQGAGAALVGVDHLDIPGADQPRDPPRRPHVPGAPHGNLHVADAGGAQSPRPVRVRRRRDRDGVATAGQADREVAQLDRRAGEVIRLRVQLEDPKRRHLRARLGRRDPSPATSGGSHITLRSTRARWPRPGRSPRPRGRPTAAA